MNRGGVPTRMRLMATRRRRRTRQRRRVAGLSVIMASVIVGVLFSMGTAFAYWVFSTSSSLPMAVADILPQGAAPNATVGPPKTSTVNISFPTKSTSGGTQITTYSITRYNAYTKATAGSISGSCSVVSGTVSCTDAPGAGSWEYTDTPTYGANWVGQESARSNPVLISTATGLSPASGVVGSSAQISAQGFSASQDLTVTVGGTSAPITSGGTTGTNGSTTVTFAIPAVPSGAQAVVVSDGTSSATSGTDFVVNAAVSLSPSSGTVGTTGVTITGTGYVAGTAVSASFAGSPLTLIPASPTVAADGTWSARFTVPSTPNGSQVITANDNGGASASTNFTVTASATGLSPASGVVGVTGVTISAQGFVSSQDLTVTVGGTSAPITSGGTTGTNGSTTVTFTIPAVPSGAQAVVVSDGTNSATSGTDFTVNAAPPTTVPPTTVPPTTVPPTTVPPTTVSGCVIEPNTDCPGADLSNANLTGANLTGADLTGADLTGADLTGTKLTGATVIGVTWSNTTCPDGTNSDNDGDTCVNNLG